MVYLCAQSLAPWLLLLQSLPQGVQVYPKACLLGGAWVRRDSRPVGSHILLADGANMSEPKLLGLWSHLYKQQLQCEVTLAIGESVFTQMHC